MGEHEENGALGAQGAGAGNAEEDIAHVHHRGVAEHEVEAFLGESNKTDEEDIAEEKDEEGDGDEEKEGEGKGGDDGSTETSREKRLLPNPQHELSLLYLVPLSQPFRPPRNGPAHVQMRRKRGTTGQDKAAQGVKTGVHGIDFVFQRQCHRQL